MIKDIKNLYIQSRKRYFIVKNIVDSQVGSALKLWGDEFGTKLALDLDSRYRVSKTFQEARHYRKQLYSTK